MCSSVGCWADTTAGDAGAGGLDVWTGAQEEAPAGPAWCAAIISLLAMHNIPTFPGKGACATLFVHAGLPWKALSMLAPDHASTMSDPATLVDRINAAFQGMLWWKV